MTEVETPVQTETSQPDLTKSTDPIDRITLKRQEAEKKQPKTQAIEPPAETKAETTDLTKGAEQSQPIVKEEGKKEEKAEVKAEAKPKREAKKKNFWKKEDKAQSTTDTPEGQPQTKEQPQSVIPKEIQDKLGLLDTILNDPSVKLVLKAKESGKDFVSYYDELRGRDPYKMSYSDIYKMQLEEQGLSANEIERKMNKFNDEKDEDEQLDTIAIYRKQLKERFDGELKDYTPSFKAPEQEATPYDYLEEDIKKITPTLKGREIFGIEATPERLKAATDLNSSLVNIVDGKLDAQDYLETVFLKQNFPVIAETIWEQAELATTEKLEALYNVGGSLSATTASATPQPRKEENDAETKRVQNLVNSLPQRQK